MLDFIIDAIASAPPALLNFSIFFTGAATLVAEMQILPVRHSAVYVLFKILLALILIPLRTMAPLGGALLSFCVTHTAVPFIFWKGPYRLRILALFIMLVITFTCEVSATLIWSVLTEGSPPGNEYVHYWPAEWLAINLYWCVLMLFLGTTASRALAVYSKQVTPVSLWWFCLPIAQVLITWVLVWFGQMNLSDSTGYYLGPFAIISASLLIDTLLLHTAYRAQETQRYREIAKTFQEQLDSHLAMCSHTADKSRSAFAARHGVRNHLQVLQALMNRGDVEAAQTYAHNVRLELPQHEETNTD